MTVAAERFLKSVAAAWDSRDCWELTAAEGLSEFDDDALVSLCDDEGEDYPTAYREVMAAVREKVANMPVRCVYCEAAIGTVGNPEPVPGVSDDAA